MGVCSFACINDDFLSVEEAGIVNDFSNVVFYNVCSQAFPPSMTLMKLRPVRAHPVTKFPTFEIQALSSFAQSGVSTLPLYSTECW
jgi:hypothetical protein